MLALLLPGTALAADAPEAATVLQGEQSFALPGGLNGHVAYFKLSYPGGWPVTIELRPHTEDKAILKYVGFKVYGPEAGREYVDGRLDLEGNWHGSKELFSDDRGDDLVQVYNYYPDPTTALGYTLLAQNIPPQGGPPPEPVKGQAGHTPIELKGTAPQTGSLEAASGGSFRYYSFHAARETNVTVSLQVEPNSQGILERAGFKVYGPERGKEYLQSELDTGRRPNQRGTLWVTRSGTYIVQVYNYNPQLSVDYRI